MPAENAAIYFQPEGYTTVGRKLMGRQAAGEGFLAGFMRHAGVDTLYCYAPKRGAAEHFARLRDRHAQPRVPVRWIASDDVSALRLPGTLYLPGPNLADMAWRRRRVGESAFGLCGVTHTIASHAALDALAGLLSAPLAPWDALVCTSRAVRAAVERVLQDEGEYLRARLGATALPRPTLGLIPLGADCDALAPDAAARAAWRTKLSIADDDVAFLFVGRLSFHAKANPFPMYVALDRVARGAPRRVHLIQAGWFDNAGIEAEFQSAAQALCPTVNAVFLDGRDPAVRSGIWHAADVFTSLVDNIQETFGLTPVEAMAAGLPCVVSDWDGYRDTVRDGLDGFRVATLAPPAGAGIDLARRHEDETDTYDRYIGYASLATSVDVPACTAACAALAADPALRRRLGEAGRARARAEFDWSVIVRRYQALWAECGELRRRAQGSTPAGARTNPRRPDPFRLFAGYATRTLAADDRLALAPDADPARLAELSATGLVNFAPNAIVRRDFCTALLARLAAEKELSVAQALEGAAPDAAPALYRSLVWLHKQDLLRVLPAAATR